MLARNQVLCSPDQFLACKTVVWEFLIEFDVSMLERLTEITNLDLLCKYGFVHHYNEFKTLSFRIMSVFSVTSSILDNFSIIFISSVSFVCVD